VCRWLLLRLHDVELTSQRDSGLLGPFHKCNWSDFGRVRDAQGRSNFFGLEVTHKSLLTNLAALAIAVCIAYWIVPRSRLFRAVYDNIALTTAALIFGRDEPQRMIHRPNLTTTEN